MLQWKKQYNETYTPKLASVDEKMERAKTSNTVDRKNRKKRIARDGKGRQSNAGKHK